MATLVVLILFLTHKLVSCWLSADGNEMTAKIDLAVAKLKKINLTNEEDLEILRCVNGNFSSENVNNLYSTMFAERGGIQVLNTWLNFFYSKSHTDHNTALFKPYCGVILSILVWGTHFFPFSQKIVQSGLLRLLIRFMMQDKLFGDDDFTDDFLFTSSTAVENLEHFESLLPEVQYVIQKAIHQQSAQVHHRFCSEQNKIVKLRLAFLLGSQNLSTMSDEDLESTFSLSPIELLGVREKLKTILISENNTIIYQPRTSYIPYYSWVPYWKLLRMFNVLLLSKSNRLTLCKDKQTVEYYFYGVKNLTKQNSNFIELASLYTVALRGLYILSLSCPNYQEHMDEAELSGKLLFKVDH